MQNRILMPVPQILQSPITAVKVLGVLCLLPVGILIFLHIDWYNRWKDVKKRFKGGKNLLCKHVNPRYHESHGSDYCWICGSPPITAFIKPGEMHKKIEGDIILWKGAMTDFIQRLAQIADVGKTGICRMGQATQNAFWRADEKMANSNQAFWIVEKEGLSCPAFSSHSDQAGPEWKLCSSTVHIDNYVVMATAWELYIWKYIIILSYLLDITII